MLPLLIALLTPWRPPALPAAPPPREPAVHLAITAAHWLVATHEVEGLAGRLAIFEAQPPGTGDGLTGPAWDALDGLIRRLKARATADDTAIRGAVVAWVDADLPVDASYRLLTLATQAGFGPMRAAVGTPDGPGRVAIAAGHTACWPDHPDPVERGKIDWDAPDPTGLRAAFIGSGISHGPPHRCAEVRVWLAPGGAVVRAADRWTRDRCSGPPGRPAAAPLGDLMGGLAALPVGARCARGWLDVDAAVTWGAFIAAHHALRAAGIDQVVVGFTLP